MTAVGQPNSENITEGGTAVATSLAVIGIGQISDLPRMKPKILCRLREDFGPMCIGFKPEFGER